MAKYRNALPHLGEGSVALADGGLETDLIFHRDIQLTHFAACELLRSERGIRTLTEYYDEVAQIAVDAGLPFTIDTVTWRANPDWTEKLGYSDEEFDEVNRLAVDLAAAVRRRHETLTSPMVITALIGPRGDGYDPGDMRSAREAMDYHSRQVGIFEDSEADMIAALTLSYSSEAVGIARAARAAEMPIAISFTVETDGRLASGESLRDAIKAVEVETSGYPEYYMVNCSHPTHLPADLDSGEPWALRVRGYRANASAKSHAELDDAEDLDDGDPDELATQIVDLRERMPQLAVLGGCCGTDSRHIAALAAALAP